MQTKICTKCNEEKELSQFVRKNKNRDDVLRSHCKDCLRNYRTKNRERDRVRDAAYRKNNRDKINARQNATPKGRYTIYKTSAKQRDLSFDLSFEEFCSFWQADCSYCGGAIATIGLDRVDSDKGYQLDNVVPCCTMCNSMKLDYSEGEWLDKMLTILKHKGVI